MSNLFSVSNVSGHQVDLRATHKNHFGVFAQDVKTQNEEESFTSSLKSSLQEANSLQQNVTDITQAYITDPESVDAHDVTIAISKANMAIDITKSVVDGALKAYNSIINMR